MSDIIVIGAGIAGLRIALELKKINKSLNITILEKYKKAGGRFDTIRTKVAGKEIQYESGAGRIHSSHKRFLSLLEEHDIKTYRMSPEELWRPFHSDKSTQNYFREIWEAMCEEFDKIPNEIKRTKTLRDIAIDTLGIELALAILETYPYRSEIEVMSADSALELFKSLKNGYFVGIQEGFSSVIDKLNAEAIKQNIKFKFNTSVNHIDYKDEKYTVKTIHNETQILYKADRVIVAVPRNSIEHIYPFSPDHAIVKSVRMEPLLRIYSVYEDSSWIQSERIITNSPLRYIIPISKEKGIVMSSYTDSRDIELWYPYLKKEVQLRDKIQFETQSLLPELNIPEAIYTKAHLWKDGCSYWLPNGEDFRLLSESALNPMPDKYPDLHVIGESFSLQQQWTEGALEHADSLVDHLREKIQHIID